MATDMKDRVFGKMQLTESQSKRNQRWEFDFAAIISSLIQEGEETSGGLERSLEQQEADHAVTLYMPQTILPTKARAVQSRVPGTFGSADQQREKEEKTPQGIGKFPPMPADTRAYSSGELVWGTSHEGAVLVPVGGLRPRYRRILSNVDFLTALSRAQAAAIARKRPAIPTPADRVKFRKLATRWIRDTEGVSIHSRAIMHRAYQQIIGMGTIAIPLLLEALRDQPDHWMWALSVLSDEDPAKNAKTFMQARAAWLRWGAEKGYLGD